MTFNASISLRTKEHLDIIDITGEVSKHTANSGIKNGIVTLFIDGSTGAITSLEFESGLITDLKEALETLFPHRKNYRHHQTWGDDNGCSHLQSAFLKTSFSVPIVDGRLTLGTWQQIIFIECDTRPRNRRIVVQIVGE